MAIPFALVTGGGCCPFFIIILLISTTTLFCQRCAMSQSNGMPPLLLHHHHVNTRFTLNESNTRRVWDPGIECDDQADGGCSYFILSFYYCRILSFLYPHHHQAQGASSTATDALCCDGLATMASTMLTVTTACLKRRVWDPGKSSTLIDKATRRRLYVFRSLFHYLHPSLSRPTVPNIQ